MIKQLAAGIGILSVCSCSGTKPPSSPTTPEPPAPTANRPPVIGSLIASPTGAGLQSATNFTFTGQGVSDPDGDGLTFSWSTTEGTSIPSTTQSATHVFGRAGTFDVRLTATDARGLSTSATVSMTVGTVTGIWDVTCDNRSAEARRLWPNFPAVFVVSLTQSGTSLPGSMSGGGFTRNFTFPGTASNPRRVSFGVETFDNVWANRDGDFYFTMSVDENLTSMTSVSSSFYCGSSVGRRR